MNNSITIMAKGKPVAKGRPRACIRFGRVHMYTPKNTADAEKALAEVARHSFREPITTAVKLEIAFFMPVPKSYTKKRKAGLYGQPHLVKPDLDNFIKTVCDALNGIVYVDDSQVYKVEAWKRYVEKDLTAFNEPRTVITIHY